MSTDFSRRALRANQTAILSDERKMTEAALKSLRDYRRERFATRQMPSQPKAA